MALPRPANLVLALGNDILGDDAVSWIAAHELKKRLPPSKVEIIQSAEAGLALIEILTDFERALIMDSIKTGNHRPGTIIEFTKEDLTKIVAPSPHYAGLPEVLSTAGRHGIPLPPEIRILAIEVVNPFEVREGLSPEVKAALPDFIVQAESIITSWTSELR